MMIVVVNRWFLRKGIVAMAIWPFIIFRDREIVRNPTVLNHEKIHLRQQLELLIVLFYLWYVLEFLVRCLQYKSGRPAYKNISFEKEAYANEDDFMYLRSRRFLSHLNFI